MTRSVADKMGIKAGTRTLLVDAPREAIAAIKLPDLDVKQSRRGRFGFIHLFVRRQAELNRRMPKLVRHLDKGGMLWVSWQKGRAKGSDLTLPEIIRIGYRNGLVESTTLSVDDTWSAIKFTHPKAGKEYRNSYGKLARPRRLIL